MNESKKSFVSEFYTNVADSCVNDINNDLTLLFNYYLIFLVYFVFVNVLLFSPGTYRLF